MADRLTQGALEFDAALTARELSQTDVAEMFDVTPTCISDWRRGRRVPREFRHVDRMRAEFGIDPAKWSELSDKAVPPVKPRQPAPSTADDAA